MWLNGGVKCYLFRLCHFDILLCPQLLKLLKSDSIVKLGVGIDGDMKKLSKEFDSTIIHGTGLMLSDLA